VKIEQELKQNKFRSNVHKALVNVMFTNAWISDRFRFVIDKNPDLTRLCDRLVVLGYIDRCINDENKRKMNIRINDKGLEILNDIDPLMNAVQSEMHGLTDLEASQLSDLLDKLRNS